MLRMMSLITTGLILLPSSPIFGQKKPITSKSALAAKKDYALAIAKAKKEYVEKLSLAIKEAGGKGDLEEANRLAAEKKRIEKGTNSVKDPLEAFRRKLIGTKWSTSPKNPKNWIRFLDKNAGLDYRGIRFNWFVTGRKTVVYQYPEKFNFTIYMFYFGDDYKAVTGYTFNKNSKTFQVKRLR